MGRNNIWICMMDINTTIFKKSMHRNIILSEYLQDFRKNFDFNSLYRCLMLFMLACSFFTVRKWYINKQSTDLAIGTVNVKKARGTFNDSLAACSKCLFLVQLSYGVDTRKSTILDEVWPSQVWDMPSRSSGNKTK